MDIYTAPSDHYNFILRRQVKLIPMAGEKDKGILGFRLGPVRRAIYGLLETKDKPSPAPAQARPVDELGLMADRAAKKYREMVERATERYRKRWEEAMRK